jgi:hypothetical protein
MAFTNERYEVLRDVFRGVRLPFAFVDLDAFDADIDYVVGVARGSGRII